jgi:predicted metal-dependent hydrolase
MAGPDAKNPSVPMSGQIGLGQIGPGQIGPAAEIVIVHGRTASLRWRRSARARRIGLRIDPVAGDIVITLPPRGSRRTGLSLLREHEAWIAAKLDALPMVLRIEAGGMIPVFGRPHRILHAPGERGGAWIEAQTIHVAGGIEFLARRVRDALGLLARDHFSRLALEKARGAGLQPSAVRVRDTSSRWGSCAPDGALMFSWRLIMAPEFVQDYVVAHEVSHLRHMNHGRHFWALVGALTPHRDQASAWLNQHGQGLLRIS